MIQAVADGQFDAAGDGITIRDDRAEIVDFSMGYMAIEQRLLVRIDETRIESIEDIVADETLKLGTQTGTTNYETALTYLPADRISAFEQFPFAVQALIAGDIDAVMIDETAGLGYMGENSDSVIIVGPSMSSDLLGFIYPLGSELVEPVDLAITELWANGFMAQVNAKYFSPDFDVTYDDLFPPDPIKIGLVTDVGEIDDKSFNQSAWEGVQLAGEEFGAEVDYIETKDAKDYMANIELFTKNDFDIVVTVGFALGEATLEAAALYPDVYFIGVDQGQWGGVVENVAGLIFNEDKSGFMAGALAGLLTETNTVAAVLGTDLIPPVVAFKEGYESGAAYVNPDVNVISTYHPGGLDVAFTDPEWGATTAKQALDSGADVVFGAGGKTGNGALIETAGVEGAYCIGVDSDQWFTVPEAHSCLVTSAMKLIDSGVFDLIKLHQAGEPYAGSFFGAVALAPFHDFDADISQDIKDKLAEISELLANNELDTGYPPED
jgi:basic membrane protein A